MFLPGVHGAQQHSKAAAAAGTSSVLDGTFSWLFDPGSVAPAYAAGTAHFGTATTSTVGTGPLDGAPSPRSRTSTALHRATRPLQARGGAPSLVASRLPAKLVVELRRLRVRPVPPTPSSDAQWQASALIARRRGFGVLDIADISGLDDGMRHAYW